MGVRRARDIRAIIMRRMDLWERGPHAGLVGYAEAEGGAREGRATSGGEEEEEAVSRRYHETVLLSKLWKAVRQATGRQGGGCLLPDDKCTKTGRLVADPFQEKHPEMRVPPVENTTCAAF